MISNDADEMSLAKSVLHPTDFSPASERAFAHALAIALLRQTDFTILHVNRHGGSRVPWHRFPPVRRTLERWGLLEPGSPKSAVFEEFRVTVRKTAVRGRHPILATARYLDRQAADLIVMATEGRVGISRWMNRSNAEAMARWSQTMTLFVPADAKRNMVSLKDGDLRLDNILVPVDRQPDCSAALEFATRAARIIGDGDVVITLLNIGDFSIPTNLLAQGSGWRWRSLNRHGDPVREILTVADAIEADLIVMPTAGHDSVLDAFRGNTTERVLRRAPCPLLAVPAR